MNLNLRYKLLFSLFIFVVSFSSFAISFMTTNNVIQAETKDYKNIIYLQLKDGLVVIKLFDDIAPNHVARIKELARSGFYDDLKFHRVIEGFMVQTGDPKGDGTGGSGQKLKAEFSKVSHERGIVSMARASDPNSADSQFFIVTKDSKFLDGQYTVVGKVISGMEFVDKIKKGDSRMNGQVINPDRIISMKLAEDVEASRLK